MATPAKPVRLLIPACHRLPERSFFWKGRQFPLCARCTGIYSGYLALPLFAFNLITLPLWVALLLVVPTAADGWLQLRLPYQSNNTLRFVSGALAGIGGMALADRIGLWIGNGLLLLF